MSPRYPRFVTACQQLLVLGVICAALTPAANVVSLELVPRGPVGGEGASAPTAADAGDRLPDASMAAYARASTMKARVPTTRVDAVVEEYSLTAPLGAKIKPGALAVDSRRTVEGSDVLLSDPQPVTGYGAVGVTWANSDASSSNSIAIEIRTQEGDSDWSDWTAAEYDFEHGPDAGSAEGAGARPGTEPVLVGAVDEVQVRVDNPGTVPADLKLAVIDPGVSRSTDNEEAAIDTATLPRSQRPAPQLPTEPVAENSSRSDTEPGVVADDLDLAAGSFTPKPQIFSRAQWGADESLRDAGSLRYNEVHAGFVHHTVNANNYKKRDVPAILRSIYAYHTQSRGWSDIGYNFLVDRFGRIWEGRYGGVGRPVVGAHTLGYNDDAFAMSAIGNFEEVRPSDALVEAYGALFAWKLSLHGIRAGSKNQFVTSRTFSAVNGHSDADSTACPGRYLYEKLPQIRTLARQAQSDFSGRQLESNVAASEQPDLVVRRTKDGRGMLIPIKATANGYVSGKPIPLALNLNNASRILNAGDWNRDGESDIITRRASDGRLFLRLGLGNGKFKRVQSLADGFKGVKLLAAVGDMTGDGFPDLMGQPNKGRPMMIYPGRGTAGLATPYVAYSRIKGSKQISVGRWDKDGSPDTLVRQGRALMLYSGNGPGGITSARQLPIDVSPYDWIVGISDVNLKGHPDLVVRAKGTGQLYLIAGRSNSLGSPVPLGNGWARYNMVE